MALSISQKCRNITPSATLRIDAIAKDMKARGLDVIGLGAGEPDFDTPAHICEAAKCAMDAGQTRYTPAGGTVSLRTAICESLLRDKGLCYAPEDIVVSNGAKHSLLTIFETLLDAGDEVIIPTPCWVSYPEMVKMAGGTPVFVETTEDEGFVPTVDCVKAAVTPRTKAIVINSPGNPTGCVWPRETLEGVARLAIDHAFYCISDEIYEKLVYDGAQHVSIAQLGDDIKAQTLVVSGMSKAYAMTGWRIGYTAGPRDVIKAMTAYQSHATSNPNSIAQAASEAALRGDQSCLENMHAAFARRRRKLLARVARMSHIRCFAPRGAFYVMLDVRSLLGRDYAGIRFETATDFAAALLRDALVAVVPGEAFMAPGYCRVSYAVRDDKLMEAMDRIERYALSLTAAA